MDSPNFGKLFKEIRIRKGFKANEVADGIVSVQFLRRFEKGEADIRLSNFYYLLERIHISFEEFMTEMEVHSLDYMLDKLDRTFDKIVLTGDTIALDTMMEDFDTQYRKTGEIRYFHFCIICKALYNSAFHTDFPLETDRLFAYLQRCETWSKYEFFVAKYTVDTLSDAHIRTMGLMALEKKVKSRSLRDYALEFSFQVAQILLRHGQIDYVAEIITAFRTSPHVTQDLADLGFNIAFRFLEGVLAVQRGDERGHDICKAIIGFYRETIHYTGYANNLQRYYRRVSQVKPDSKE